MILSVAEFLACGLPVSSDISEADVENCIFTVEEYYLKPRITDENYIDLLTEPTEETNAILISGGTMTDEVKHFAGLKKGICYLTFAYMMANNYRVTRYSTVEKNSEFSRSVSRADLLDMARTNWEIGEQFVREVVDFYGIEWDITLPNLYSTLF